LRIFVATPNGLGGRGGIDRMNDMLIEVMSAAPELNVVVERLVTRGNGNIVFAPIVLARALLRVWWAARQHRVDVVHICFAEGQRLSKSRCRAASTAEISALWSCVIGVGTATTKTSAVWGAVTARSLPDFTAAASTMSRSGSTIWARPELMRSTASRLMSTPTTSKPRAANVAAVGSPT
jgi:hypothetical protein